MNKKIAYYFAVMVFIISAFAVFFIYKSITAKENKIGLSINKRIAVLKSIQTKINESIKGIRKTDFPILRYGYSFNKNEKYFMSEIIGAGRKYGIKLDKVQFIKVNKKNNAADFYFSVSGSGHPGDIYYFVKDLEYNYKINFKKFYIDKNINKNNFVSFSSILAAYVISKQEALESILKSKSKIKMPKDLGAINPFLYIVKKKKKAAAKPKAAFLNYEKIKKKSNISERVYKKLAKKTAFIKEPGIQESNFYNKKGVLSFSQNNFSDALIMFKKALRFNPDNYRALSNAALDEYEIKNYKASVYYAKKALEYKKLWQINFILGLSYMRLKMFSDAEYNFRKALELNPSDEKIKYYLNISKKIR
ncbi:MAG: tetratricopeptide repeat protein [Candidatus Acidulodesulfobacterium sp.]